MRIAREEIFGPVLSVLRVKNFDEAMQVANDCEYGLSSSIFSNDAARIFRFVDEIETGMTHINSPHSRYQGNGHRRSRAGLNCTGFLYRTKSCLRRLHEPEAKRQFVLESEVRSYEKREIHILARR